ncbi:MAG TPA: hypothetical protein VN688_23130 [Gemmataceae bacterium]|nr:hypothetical protein [Gemmataceae bacterium]
MAYVKQAESVYAKQVRARVEKPLHRRALELGFEVQKLDPLVVATVE